MRREWEPDELIACWTLVEADQELVANKSGATRLGFALLLKFFELEARFPRDVGELPPAAVSYVAEQVGVHAGELDGYPWSGRTIEYHRAQVRQAYGFRETARSDESDLAAWLAEEVCPVELSRDRLREAVLVRCRELRIEPPGRVDRIVGAAVSAFEHRFCADIVGRLSPETSERLHELIAGETDGVVRVGGGRGLLSELKADPGRLGLETLLGEIAKLERIRALSLPGDLFSGYSEKLTASWRARAATQYPSDLRASSPEVRLTLLAALCSVRTAEITDSLVDLLIALSHKINARAENRVEGELIRDLKRVAGKQAILFRVAEASLADPDGTVRRVVFPAAGEATLRELVREAKANEAAFKARVRTVLSSSYSAYYRRMLPRLLGALDFRCDNSAYRPVMDALALVRRYADHPGRVKHYDPAERVPIDGVVPREWRNAVLDDSGRVQRVAYELCVLRSLRDALRRREIYVAGATRWRNPEADLPADFAENRAVHYDALRQPMDATAFIAMLQASMRRALVTLDERIADGVSGVRITTRRGEPWITVPQLGKLSEAPNLAALKAEIERRWGTLGLLDVFKDADHLTALTDQFATVASREAIPRAVLRRRLLLVLFALGTNMGIKRIVSTGGHGESEAALRHVRRMYVSRDSLRRAIATLVNATFAARVELPRFGGQGLVRPR